MTDDLIDGIMQQMTLEAKVKDDSMQDAFKDLEILMVRAGEMVSLYTKQCLAGSW